LGLSLFPEKRKFVTPPDVDALTASVAAARRRRIARPEPPAYQPVTHTKLRPLRKAILPS
jgi:hypothetical protein